MGSYSRTGYFALIQESVENTALKPNKFIPLMSQDIVTQYGATPAMPISANRTRNLRPIITAIEPPSGTLKLLVEPKTIGYLLKGVYGAVTTGRFFAISSVSGTFQVGETVTGGTSSATATVVAVSAENDYLLMSAPTGTFTAAGETITGGTSSATATLGANSSTVYGHQFTAPQNSLPTFTLEFGFDNEAYRLVGARFNSFESVGQEDNIIAVEVGVFARSEFKHARVTAVLASGSGSKTISLDQTTGLVAADTIKVFRPSTGAFLDFSASSVKTHTIGTVASETSITVTDLQTSLAVGDLIVLAPQTPSYTIDKEFSWIGGSTMRIGTTMTSALSATADSIENFELKLVSEMEGKHGANGTNVVNRFPAANFLKGLTGEGKINRTYTDMAYLDKLRNNTQNALQISHQGSLITSTIYFRLDWRTPNAIFDAFNPNLGDDDLLEQEMPFKMYYDATQGYLSKALLVNTTSSY